jgi:hypothetical protein
MQRIKGKTWHYLLQDRRKLRAEFWGRHLWSRGYFVCASGNVTDEVIARDIEQQDVAKAGDEDLSGQRIASPSPRPQLQSTSVDTRIPRLQTRVVQTP